MPSMLKYATLHVAPEVHRRFKVVAAARGIAIVDLMAILAAVAEQQLAKMEAPGLRVVPNDTEGI